MGRGRRWGVWSRSWSFMRYFSSGQISPASSHLDGLRHNGQLATPALTGVTFLLPSLCPSRLLPCSLGMPLESTQHSIRASLACMSQDNKLEYSCDFALLPCIGHQDIIYCHLCYILLATSGRFLFNTGRR